MKARSLLLTALFLTACASESNLHSSEPTTAPSLDEEAKMKAYIDDFVDLRFVRATFDVPDRGHDGFCVDFDKQPSCLRAGAACPSSPPAPPSLPGGSSSPEPRAAAICPAGTVPILRPRIEVLRRFRTLEDYQRGNKGPPPRT